MAIADHCDECNAIDVRQVQAAVVVVRSLQNNPRVIVDVQS